MDKYVGKRLDGRYEIQEIIGVGGMAVVYKAYDNQENRIVAIKILKEEFVSNEEFLRRFKNESKAIAMLSHPNIVRVFDVSFGDLIQYIIMEYIEGITLKEYIERQGSLRWKDAVHFTLQILKALQHAHDKGIIHRDVKPQNIMVLSDGTIKVTDFGIARLARSEQRTITDKAIGSVHYISPEQARGERTDERADIYSVGVMLYEMLTGKLPFQAESAVSVAIMQLQREPQLPTEINGSIPLGLEQITMHAMQKNPERRYQSAAEMLYDLSQFRKDPSLTFDYSYFVDDAPTKFVAPVDDYDMPPAAPGDEAEVKEKNNMIPILAGIAVTLVVAIIVLAVMFIPKLFSDTGEEIECPKFIGQKYEDVKDNEEYKENFVFEPEWQENSEYEYGYIFEQSKAEGQKLKKGATITLTISLGQTTKKVPDVYGKSEAAAVSELKSNGFQVKTAEIPSEDVEKGMVVRTEPARTTVVAEGEEITVYISSGKEVKNVDVPDVVGMKRADAEKAITDKNLVVKVEETKITMEDKYYPVGYVVRQDPDNGQKPEGSTITIYVSTGVTLDIEIEMPSDPDYPLEVSTCYVSLWQDGVMVKESPKLSADEASKYTFEGISSDKETAEYTVKIRSDESTDKESKNYLRITVDFKTGRYDITREYTDYTDLVPEDSSSDIDSSDDNTSSDGQ